MRRGDRVLHRLNGLGSILSLQSFGRAMVRFDGLPELPMSMECRNLFSLSAPVTEPSTTKTKTKVRRAESSAPEARGGLGTRTANVGTAAVRIAAAPPVESPAPKRKPQRRPIERGSAWQALEALRLGVVPAEHVESYTLGREKEIDSVRAMLEARSGLRVLFGDYGFGKTHLLDVVEHLALQQGFLTARVSFDAAETPPTHPKRLYRQIVARMRYPDTDRCGLDPLFERLATSADHRSSESERFSRFFSPHLFALHHGDDGLLGWTRDYVQGDAIEAATLNRELRARGYRETPPLALSDYRTYGRVYGLLLGTLAAWSTDAGYRGTILLLDEVECIDGLGPSAAEYALQTIRHLAAVTLPEASLGFDPESEDDLYRGGQPVHRELPLKYSDDQALSAVFALTPLEDIEADLQDFVPDRSVQLRLARLPRDCTGALFRGIQELYVAAFPGFAVEAAREQEILRDLRLDVDLAANVRSMVREIVFALDAERLRAVPWRS